LYFAKILQVVCFAGLLYAVLLCLQFNLYSIYIH